MSFLTLKQIIRLQKLSSLCKFILMVSVDVVKQTELMATCMKEKLKGVIFLYKGKQHCVCDLWFIESVFALLLISRPFRRLASQTVDKECRKTHTHTFLPLFCGQVSRLKQQDSDVSQTDSLQTNPGSVCSFSWITEPWMWIIWIPIEWDSVSGYKADIIKRELSIVSCSYFVAKI